MLGGLPIIGTLAMLGALVMGTFTINAMGGHVAGGLWFCGLTATWAFFAFLYAEDSVFMPMFWIRQNTKFSHRTESFAPSSQEWEIL